MRDRITINKALIPYQFDILLGGELFTIGVNYNNTANLVTLALYKNNELVCAGEPLIYGMPLWGDFFQSGNYPALTIIPMDESGEHNAITYDNLNKTVFLTIDNLPEGGDDHE